MTAQAGYNLRMFRMLACLSLMLSVLLALPARASRQDIGLIEAQARAFAVQGWQGAAVRLSFGQLDRRLGLPACPSPVYAWDGKTRETARGVKISCVTPAWSIRLPIRAIPSVLVVMIRRTVAAGQLLTAEDLDLVESRDGNVPLGAFGRTEDVIGKPMARAVAPGMMLRREMLALPLVVRQGQTVRIVADNPAFNVSAQGIALTAGSEGQSVGVRLPSGRILRGTARADGSVAIRY